MIQVTWDGSGPRAAEKKSLRIVPCITARVAAVRHAYAMESTVAVIKVIRELPDGQSVSVGAYESVREARRMIESLSEYWPGDYRILRSGSFDWAKREAVKF